MEKKLKITISVLFAALFGAFIAMLKIVDVQPIGPAGTSSREKYEESSSI